LAASKRAEADEFVGGLTDPKGRKGYDAHVGERGDQTTLSFSRVGYLPISSFFSWTFGGIVRS
jgi:hypothetical protein